MVTLLGSSSAASMSHAPHPASGRAVPAKTAVAAASCHDATAGDAAHGEMADMAAIM
jgi:hypothetical protein